MRNRCSIIACIWLALAAQAQAAGTSTEKAPSVPQSTATSPAPRVPSVAPRGGRGRAARATAAVPPSEPEAAPGSGRTLFAPVSDLVSGYVTSFNRKTRTFGLRMANGSVVQVKLKPSTYAEVMRNLGESFQAPRHVLDKLINKGRYLSVQGISYPDAKRPTVEATQVLLAGRRPHQYRFEEKNWWPNQIDRLARFYLKAQFPDGHIDFRRYRTHVSADGRQLGSARQETDTISRLIYGLSTAYMMTGKEEYLELAEKGTEYLRNHMLSVDAKKQVGYWLHGVDIEGNKEKRIVASEFDDDKGAIPAYEQIYALAGPVQTYRITGDKRILRDAELTVNLFDRYFRDRKQGGYFSHIDPVTFDPRAESLKGNRARKNWNSVGDHAPAYLINLYLATGDKRYATMLADTANTILTKFPRDDSPFVQERFYEDWAPDKGWGWQQDRGVIGHNLKIAWNLMRMINLMPREEFLKLSERLARDMAHEGMDKQRGGFYDVVERTAGAGEQEKRHTWHDRKAWWQQEQAILAYLILAGMTGKPEYLRLARESSTFFNMWFNDHDLGGHLFNVQANGRPHRSGTELLKGSHAMAGYHSFELAYLAHVYSNLLVLKRPIDLYFKPKVGGFADNTLRVAPDLLPPGRVRLDAVWLDGKPYHDFDPVAMTVKLPAPPPAAADDVLRPSWAGNKTPGVAPKRDYRVKVRLTPLEVGKPIQDTFTASAAAAAPAPAVPAPATP